MIFFLNRSACVYMPGKESRKSLCLSLALAWHGDMLMGKRETETGGKKPGKSVGIEFSRETQQHQQETQRQMWIHMNTFPLWRKCCPSRLVLINCGFLKAYGKSVLRQPSCNKLPLSKTVGHLGLLDKLNMASRAPCVHCQC